MLYEVLYFVRPAERIHGALHGAQGKAGINMEIYLSVQSLACEFC